MRRTTMIALLLLTLVAAPAHSGEKADWTWTDTGLQATYLTLHTMDWAQTLHMSRNPDKFYENNGLLGLHPSEGRVNSYFAVTALGHTAVSYILPKPWRTVWQGFWITTEYAYVQHNRKIGVGSSLHF